jgi:uncharacterized membrane protein
MPSEMDLKFFFFFFTFITLNEKTSIYFMITNEFLIYFLAFFIAVAASLSSNFVNIRTRGSKNVDAIRNGS